MNRRDALKSLAAVPLVGMVKALCPGCALPVRESGVTHKVLMARLSYVGMRNDKTWRGHRPNTVMVESFSCSQRADGLVDWECVFNYAERT